VPILPALGRAGEFTATQQGIAMFTEYSDILEKIPEAPQWWDEHRVPRYSRR
jgi:hypothetical protein